MKQCAVCGVVTSQAAWHSAGWWDEQCQDAGNHAGHVQSQAGHMQHMQTHAGQAKAGACKDMQAREHVWGKARGCKSMHAGACMHIHRNIGACQMHMQLHVVGPTSS